MSADLQTIVFPIFMDAHTNVIILTFTCAEGTDFNLY